MSADSCPIVFITGTDTGVGKTFVAAALARYFSRQGLNIGVMKPIETDVADLSEPGNDAQLLMWAADAADSPELVAPYRFSLPVAPAQAAEATGTHIDVGQIEVNLKKISHGKDLVLVEGAGGLMVPIQGGYLMADLIKKLQIPLLVVTHPRLGTINHTLLTTFTAQALGLELLGFLVNKMPEKPDDAEAEAAHYLASLASTDLLGVLPEVAGNGAHHCIDLLAGAVATMQTLPWLKMSLGIN